MRMACDNSYLVDHSTDHGPKVAEITTVLEEMLEQPDAKVVIFSQWLRMHELLVKKVKEHGWGHVMFHGSVPSGKRKDLIDRFRDDPNCRLFLSTDAGGTGLNLQHASVVINVDLPWNPAVLEQRIGRVHRLGQNRTVRVINFIAQRTIEEGMLSVLQFKKSLFAGVLDGGEKDVFLGGSRLNRFMEQVEAATSAIPEALLEDAEEAARAPTEPEGATATLPMPRPKPTRGRGQKRLTRIGASGAATAGTGTATAATGQVVEAANPWAGLLTAGMALLQQLAGAGGNGSTQTAGTTQPAAPRVMRDEQTGETYLKVPVPAPELLEQALQAVGSLLESLRR
jgi:superfamily II DNA/RNA helicase